MMKVKKNPMYLTSSGKIFLRMYQRKDTVAIERNNANTSTSTISSIRKCGGAIRGIIAFLSPTSQAFCHVDRDTSLLIFSEQLGCRSPVWLLLEINIGQLLPLVSRTTKQASLSSSMDQGGGKRRVVIAGNERPGRPP